MRVQALGFSVLSTLLRICGSLEVPWVASQDLVHYAPQHETMWVCGVSGYTGQHSSFYNTPRI